MKTCTKCGEFRDESLFPKSGGNDKLSSWCRCCHSKRNRDLKKQLGDSNLEFFKSDPIGLIKRKLDEKNLSMRWLSEQIGVNEQNVYKWFNKFTTFPFCIVHSKLPFR